MNVQKEERQTAAFIDTTKPESVEPAVGNSSQDCYAYLTELVRSSNFPFKKIEKTKVNILIDEDTGKFLRLKLFVDADGSGTLGWAEYFPAERRLMNTSANLETPEELKFDQSFAQQYESCTGTSAGNAAQRFNSSCITTPITKLPVTESLLQWKEEFQALSCHLQNEEEYLCGKKYLTALSLFENKDHKILAVPMDCGDFTYRYYLIIVKGTAITDGIYAEGEWAEPGNEGQQEKTSFSVDERYTLSITTKGTVSKQKTYRIDAAGKWVTRNN